MPYATQSDLADRLSPELLQELADVDGDTVPDCAVLDAVLADAASEINVRLAGRYATPLDPAPAILTRWCVDLAVADLFLRRNMLIPAAHVAAAALTRRALQSLADGLTGLAGATPRPLDYETENTKRGKRRQFECEELY